MRVIYAMLLTLAAPFIVLRLLWRARRQHEYLQHISERFGFYANDIAAREGAPYLWLHAVSVGETRGAEPLLRALREKYPHHRILLTHMTPTGRAAGESLFGDDVTRCYLPYDYSWAVARFLDHFRPGVGVLMETEIWPNLVRMCRKRGVPLYLVNARLSEKSFTRYQRVGSLIHDTLQALSAIAAQTEEDAGRFRALGAREVSVAGNLKFDVEAPAEQLALGAQLRNHCSARSVLLAASTREGEEALLLDYKLHDIPDTLLAIVPRHPQRFDDVAALLEARGIAYVRRSADKPVPPDTRVLLGDSMGEMAAYYAACDAAFIGGSLLPYGGQNLIEACAVGKPVLIGPHTYNFAQATQQAIAAGAALRVTDGADLARKAAVVLTHRKISERMGAAALEFSRTYRGATQRTLEVIRF